MTVTPCDAAANRGGHNPPTDRGFTSTHLRARLFTGLLSAASLAMMSPPVALAQAAGSTSRTFYPSHRAWTSMTNRWGPVEKDRSNREATGGDGATLAPDTVTYPKALGAHAPADIRFALNRACTSLMAVGGDDEKVAKGSVLFGMWTDGVENMTAGR
jgi:hypothetical protein